jgi:hypothetical protein
MARKLHYDKERKATFTKENVMGNTMTGVRVCALCKSGHKGVLYHYWYEPDIGGNDKPPLHSLPFCSVDCYHKYGE